MSINLPILAFNDVYRVSQRYVPQPGAPPADPSTSNREGEGPKISVAQFGELVLSERGKWATKTSAAHGQPGGTHAEDRPNGEQEEVKEGLVLFAGDVFNPSVESSVTRGSHMVPIMNALKVDCACIGNHDFDFGFPHLTRLLNATTFPWLLSNIIDKTTGNVPEPLRRYWVTERCGVRIGVIGLVEQDWIATIPSWPEEFEYRPMRDVAVELSKELRDPDGEHKVEVIIALTHCRVPNDIALANELGACEKDGVEDKHGVDLLIGGHDHIYYIGKGAKSWQGDPGDRGAPGTEKDQGVRLIKSGTDFRDLTSAVLSLTPTSSGSARKRLITSLTGKHHHVLPSSPSSSSFEELVKSLLSSVSDTLTKPVCFTLTPFDARSELVRTKETALGNWVADVLLHAYAESLFEKASDGGKDGGTDKKNGKERISGRADAVIICGGTLRGDSQYGPGKISLGDILEILPFEDPVVCIEMDGKGIWDCMEGALSKWPAQEGRFPIVSGLRVEWDHNKSPGQRVNSIHMVRQPTDSDSESESPEDHVDFVEQEDGTTVEVKQRKIHVGDEVKRESGGKHYRIITREYMAQGYDGFEAMKNRKFLVDDENGQIMSSIIRAFLLGSAYIFRHKQLADSYHDHLSKRTSKVISRARSQHQSSPMSSVASSPQSSMTMSRLKAQFGEELGEKVLGSPGGSERGTGRRHVVQHDWGSIRDAMHVAKHEHLSSVDCLEGSEMRRHNTNDQPPPQTRSGEKKDQTKDYEGEKKREGIPMTNAEASFFVDRHSKEELQSLGDDLAIVSPLVDGRMRDVAAP